MNRFLQAFGCALTAVLWTLAAGTWCGASDALAAGRSPAPPARVAPAAGLLAVRSAANADWRVLAEGDALPAECFLQAAGGAPCGVHLADGWLHMEPETRVHLAFAERRATLDSGRIFLKTASDASWTVKLGNAEAVIQGHSAVEVAGEPDRPLSICILQGSAAIAAGDRPPLNVPAGSSVVCDRQTLATTVAPLPADVRKRIEAWTAAAKVKQGLGQLVIQNVQSGSPVRLDVARYHVHVVLQPPVALVQIDQSFYNPYMQRQEGTFVFNLPRGASVSRFAMYVTPDQLIEGELVDRQRAAQIYQSIVNQRRDPAILEQIGDNLFKIRVFPVPARDSKRILLDYTIPLQAADGVCQFRLPLLSDLKPIWDFSLTGAIVGPTRPGSVVSRSDDGLTVRPAGNDRVNFELKRRNYQPQSDFALEFAQPADTAASLRSYVAEPLPPRRDNAQKVVADATASKPATYFLAAVPPPAGGPTAGDAAPADVLILADTSGGMRYCPLRRHALRTIVNNLRPADRFRLLCVNAAARPLHDGWLAAGSAEAAAALARFDQEFSLGGVDLNACFHQALKSFQQSAPRGAAWCST